eukprot:maker-scaffold426_size175065-snap-gene-0.33 protein:Tk08634 transcript:maker-scaffold426_size175065-snap-gene-0.33-mRNA-1 annotation:"moxd1-like protein 2"
MLMTFYREALTADSSGMRLFYSNEPSYTKVGKMMVGHHISSKMVVMPGGEWVVEGVCPSSCSASADLTKQTEVTIHSASVHHSNATYAKLKLSQGSGTRSDPIVVSSLVHDHPANPKFQPLRALQSEAKMVLGRADISTECGFQISGTGPGEGGMGPTLFHCFGILTYSPPYPLASCTSVPTEFSLQAALGFKLKRFNDLNDFEGNNGGLRRRKRSSSRLGIREKRQSNALIHDFFNRETFTGESPNTQDSTVGQDMASILVQYSPSAIRNANLAVLAGEHLPLC